MTGRDWHPWRLIGLAIALPCLLGRSALGKEPPAPAARREAPERTVRLDELTFADERLAAKLRRMDAQANKIAGPTWHRRPYSTVPSPRAQGAYYAEWATFTEVGRNPLNYWGPREVHCFALNVCFDPPSPMRITRILLGARWKPDREGFAAYFQYGTEDRLARRQAEFQVLLMPLGANGAVTSTTRTTRWGSRESARSALDFRLRGAFYSTAADFDDTVYPIFVNGEAEADPRRDPDAEIIQMLASPEAWRDFALDKLAALSKRIEQDIPSGKAIGRAHRPGPAHRGEDLTSRRPLSDRERQMVLEEAREEIGRRTRLVKEGYQAMHAALVKAFPLRECLLASDPNL